MASFSESPAAQTHPVRRFVCVFERTMSRWVPPDPFHAEGRKSDHLMVLKDGGLAAFSLFGRTGNCSLIRSQKLHLGGRSSLVVCLGRLRANGDGGRLVRVKLDVATAHAAAVRRTTTQCRTVSARA